jgi:Zn-finger nucleic acid-binding protein
VGTCYDCWGLWIDTPHLKRLREEYPVATSLYRLTTRLEASAASPSELLCPFCPGEHLLQQGIGGVEVEWCPACRGIFLDQGERERIAGSLKQGRPSAMPGPAPVLFGTSRSPAIWSGLGVGEVLAGLAELLFEVLD